MQDDPSRRARRQLVLRELSEARALRERVQPRRTRNAKARQRYRLNTYLRG